MNFELKLAWKYLRLRRRGLVRFTSLVAVAGIAAGVAGLIVAQAIAGGFRKQMREKILANTSHITVFNESETVTANPEIITQKIKKTENVEAVLPTTYESAVISAGEGSGYAVIRVLGTESPVLSRKKLKDENNIKRIDSPASSQPPKPGTEDLPKVQLGRELAGKLKIRSGDEAEIITLGAEEKPKSVRVVVKNLFETGLYEYDSTWIIVDQKNYLKIKEIPNFSPRVFTVAVRDIYRADQTAGEIRRSLGRDFKVLDWQEANKPLFAALSLERKAALGIILLIIFIASLNITTTLALLINERKLDIAILRTVGAKTKELVIIFLAEGIILSLTGIIIGVMLGLAVCLSGNYFRLISLSKEVYSIDFIPFQFDPASILGTIGLAFLLSLAAIIYPVLKLSKIKPLENLRTQ